MLFGQLIHSGSADQVATGFFIGAAAMALGGIAELLWGVRAEQQSLENIARPLTAEEAEAEEPPAPVELPEGADARRIAERAERRRERERRGLRRLRPGVGRTFYSPGMVGTASTTSRHTAASDVELDREIEAVAAALADGAPVDHDELRRRLGARHWGPGRFRAALREAVREGRAARGPGTTYSGRATAAASADGDSQGP